MSEKNVLRDGIPAPLREYTFPLPNGDNGVRERTHQSEKQPSTY
ncbi:hypothetical protein CCYN2B_110087 [Capnocytophaga cynodegmi]|uniref:Uncharacterized protein n=1 Tax=Capnocytophaga cynodegmi TaxID=28189 RepID=A0A0B7H4L6_9FLAO|nr:hypothetical protein CCYN2B_110087 [Capnocytophaga cynodegmi]